MVPEVRRDRLGVKANVLFSNRATPGTGVVTRDLWVYDLHRSQRFTEGRSQGGEGGHSG